MVIHKPAGILTVPGKTEDLQDCMINRLVKLEPKTLLIHRLDRDTSGILVFGLSRWGQKSISRQFQERQTDKTYQAIVAGHLEGQGTVDVPVIYDPSRPPLHIAEPSHNKPAVTEWKAIEHFEIQGQPVTRVVLTPITGRSHQLRVWLYRHRKLIGGLRFVEEPAILRFFYGRLEPTSDWQQKLVAQFRKDFGDSL